MLGIDHPVKEYLPMRRGRNRNTEEESKERDAERR
jgi:hypothetical protein